MQRWYVFCAEKAIASAKHAERVASHDEFSHGAGGQHTGGERERSAADDDERARRELEAAAARRFCGGLAVVVGAAELEGAAGVFLGHRELRDDLRKKKVWAAHLLHNLLGASGRLCSPPLAAWRRRRHESRRG